MAQCQIATLQSIMCTWWLHLAPLDSPMTLTSHPPQYSVKNTAIFAVVAQGSFVAVFCRCILVEDRPKYSDRIQRLIHAWNEPDCSYCTLYTTATTSRTTGRKQSWYHRNGTPAGLAELVGRCETAKRVVLAEDSASDSVAEAIRLPFYNENPPWFGTRLLLLSGHGCVNNRDRND
jgi:hypothetical protein